MKKTYKAPFAEVVKINIEQMICDSLNSYEGNPAKKLDKEDYDDFDSSLW